MSLLRVAPRAAYLVALTLVGACLFPDYTFDEPEPTGATTATGGGATATGTTATTTGGGAGTTTSSSGGGGSGGGPPVEDCFDGDDDDGDGDADCADADCGADVECVEAIPVGWGSLGFVALFQGVVGSDPACPAEMPDTAYEGTNALSSNPAQCSPCSCGAAVGQSCSLTTDLDPVKAGVQPIQVKNLPCGMIATALNALTVPAGWDGSCFTSENLPGGQTCLASPCNASVTSAQPTVSGGTCAPGGGEATLPAPSWSIAGKACKAATSAATGCGPGLQCRPRPPPPFEPRVCVSKPGDVACPAGAYSEKHVFFTDYADTRGCSACACGGASGGSCQLTVHLFSDAGADVCSAEEVSFIAGQCKDIVGNPTVHGRSATVSQAPSGGTCPVAGGGAPIGATSPTNPRTFCCIP